MKSKTHAHSYINKNVIKNHTHVGLMAFYTDIRNETLIHLQKRTLFL